MTMSSFELKKASDREIGDAIKLDLKADDDNSGQFEGYASVFNNEDKGGDTVIPGAFATSLKSKNFSQIKMLWQHDPSQVLGTWSEIREDQRGLFVKGQLLLDVAKAREVHTLMRAGAIDSMSIGYKTIRSERDEETWTRKLLEVDVWEVSLVTFPMNAAATVTSMKKAGDIREFESQLREVFGYSKEEAKGVALHGFKALNGRREAGSGGANEVSDLMEALRETQRAFSNQ